MTPNMQGPSGLPPGPSGLPPGPSGRPPEGLAPSFLSDRQIEEYDARVRARAIANADPAPGPLLDAFDAPEIRAAGLVLQPVVASHILLLRRLNTANYRRLVEAMTSTESLPTTPTTPAKAEPEADPEEVFEELYLFTRPLAEVRAALRKGREHYRDLAISTVADQIPVGQFAGISAAVLQHLINSFATVQGYTTIEKDEGSFPPAQPAAPLMASAGGYNSLAASHESSGATRAA